MENEPEPDFEHDPFIDGLGGQPPDWYWDGIESLLAREVEIIEGEEDEIPRGD